MTPVPRIDVATWERDEGRHVAVVAVDPVAVPPSITRDGVVYERTSGQTLPVTDQVVLARLHDAGQHARSRAVDAARRAAGFRPRPWSRPHPQTPVQHRGSPCGRLGFCRRRRRVRHSALSRSVCFGPLRGDRCGPSPYRGAQLSPVVRIRFPNCADGSPLGLGRHVGCRDNDRRHCRAHVRHRLRDQRRRRSDHSAQGCVDCRG
jgi:hypothetical protein